MGKSADTFQEKHDIPKEEAQKFIEWWRTEFSTVWEWRDEVNTMLHRDGEIVTPYGRKRRFYLLTPQNQAAAHREAVNFLPQSIANDFTFRRYTFLRTNSTQGRLLLTSLFTTQLWGMLEKIILRRSAR